MDFINNPEIFLDLSASESVIWNEEKTKATIQTESFIYYVDLIKGVVAAKMVNPMEEALNAWGKVYRKCPPMMGRFDFYFVVKNKFSTPICAKATCAEADEFDLETGKKIARERCLAKYYKRLTNVFVEINNYVDPFLCEVEDSILKYSERYKKYSENQS